MFPTLKALDFCSVLQSNAHPQSLATVGRELVVRESYQAMTPISLYAGKGVKLLSVYVAFDALATAFVVLRLTAQRIKRTALRADDYMICLALFLQYVQLITSVIGKMCSGLPCIPRLTCCAGLKYGGEGVHIKQLHPDQIVLFVKVVRNLYI